MPDTSSTEPFQSSLPPLTLPPGGFQSSLPPHLLEGADEQTRYIMNEISRNSAATEFACKAAVTHNEHLRMLNGKTYKTAQTAETLRTDVDGLKAQMQTVSPITTAINTARMVLTNKMFLALLAMAILFLLGFNRDILPTIIKAIFG